MDVEEKAGKSMKNRNANDNSLVKFSSMNSELNVSNSRKTEIEAKANLQVNICKTIFFATIRGTVFWYEGCYIFFYHHHRRHYFTFKGWRQQTGREKDDEG